MAEIYNNARVVVVWLGEEDDETALGLMLLPRILASFPDISPDGDGDEDEEIPDIESKLGLVVVRSKMWNAFARLFTRPYFRRVWIVQEVALGSHIKVYCGSHILEWDDLAKASLVLITDSQCSTEALKSVQMIRAYRKQRSRGGSCKMTDVIFDTYNLECRDPRDKMYGLIGLVDEGRIGVVTPDYALSVQEAYKSATRSIIFNDGSLAILCNITYPKNLEGLPSWVPDWSSPATVRQSFGAHQQRHRNAAVGTDATVNDSVNPQELCLTGRIVGEVCRLGQVMPETEQHFIVLEWEQLARSLVPYRTGEDFPVAFWRTLIASDAKDGTRSFDSLQSLYESWNYWVNRHREIDMLSINPKHEYPKQKPPDDDIRTVNSRAREFRTLLDDASVGRKIFCTDNGYIGLAPAAAQEGDQVCILYGGPVPFMLRQEKTQGVHTIVGECFALGLMHGEGLEFDGGPVQTFNIH